ncbi:MAG: PAS domain S-box protein [Nonomuraea sp.]|nr:PAS domain S-box protein [Nonomuraea sp.]
MENMRFVLMLGTGLVLLAFLVQSARDWKWLPWGHKMLVVSLMCWGIYIVDALHAAIEAHLPWAGRLGFLAVGVASFAAFLMEPTRNRARQQRRALHAVQEDRFELLVESVADYAIYMLDPQGLIASWNVGAERIKGYGEAEVLGRHFRIFYPFDEQEARHPERNLRLALREGRYEETGWRVRKDGTAFWAHVSISPVHDAQGQHLGFAKVTKKIGEFPPPGDSPACG